MEKQKNIPQLRFPEFDGEWEKPKLSKKMEIFRGASPRPKGDLRYYGGNIPRLMIEDATRDGKYVVPKIDFLTEEGAKKSRLLEKGNFVLSCSGTKVGIPTILGVDACIHDGWIGFKKLQDVNSEFLYYIFLGLYERMQGEATTGGVFNNLTTSIVRDLRICFPEFPEQQRIASFFTAIDQKISQLKRKKTLLEQYKKGVMQNIFSQGIRFKGNNGQEFPMWEKKKLGDVFYSEKGKGISKDKIEGHGTYECILYGELYTKYKEVIFDIVSKTNVDDGLKSKRGDLLIPCSTTTTGIDLSNVTALNKENVLLGGDITVLRSNYNINNIFYAYYLSNHKKQEIACYAQGITIVHLYFSHIKDLFIEIPNIEEQTKIANFLTAIDGKINYTLKQREKAEIWKKGLMQQMFV
jgi:type I restriction enzyme S subunit